MDAGMDFDEHDTHLLMTHVTSVLLGLEILRDRTSLSDRQVAIVEHALRAANGMRDVLQERAGAPARAPGWWARAPDPAPNAEAARTNGYHAPRDARHGRDRRGA